MGRTWERFLCFTLFYNGNGITKVKGITSEKIRTGDIYSLTGDILLLTGDISFVTGDILLLTGDISI